MARDDRSDPRRPPPPNPRDLRASLSTNLGLGRRTAGEAARRPPADPPPLEPPPPEPPLAIDPSTPVWFDEPEPAFPDDPSTAWEEAAVAESAPPPPPPPPPVERRPAPVRSTGRKPAPKATTTSKAKPRRREGQAEGGHDIVPSQAIAGRALLLVVAIMGFLACLAVGGLALVAEAAHDWRVDVSREITIQVKPIDGVAIEPRLQKAIELARATNGVRSARLIDEREGAALLEPWLGKGLDLSALPIPRLVVIGLADPASADLSGLKARIAAEIRGATLDDHAVWAARLRTMADTMVVVGLGVVVLMFTAMVLSVVFATRAAIAGNRDVIEVLHFVGAEDRFIAGEFQRHFLQLGLVGGATGGAAAIFAFLVADFATRSRGDAFSDQAHALFGGFSVGWSGHLGAVTVVGLVAVLTALTSRFTVIGHLGRMD